MKRLIFVFVLLGLFFLVGCAKEQITLTDTHGCLSQSQYWCEKDQVCAEIGILCPTEKVTRYVDLSPSMSGQGKYSSYETFLINESKDTIEPKKEIWMRVKVLDIFREDIGWKGSYDAKANVDLFGSSLWITTGRNNHKMYTDRDYGWEESGFEASVGEYLNILIIYNPRDSSMQLAYSPGKKVVILEVNNLAEFSKDIISICDSKSDNVLDITNCYTALALAKGDSQICYKVDAYNQYACFDSVADDLVDISICEKINGSKDLCYRHVAEKIGDLKICDIINNPAEKDLCVSNVDAGMV